MPIKYKRIETFILEPEEKKCNRCKRAFKYNSDNMIEWQEFFHVEFEGGYGFIFGDEGKVTLDVCQTCVRVVLGEYLEVSSDWMDQVNQDREQEEIKFRRENG